MINDDPFIKQLKEQSDPAKKTADRWVHGIPGFFNQSCLVQISGVITRERKKVRTAGVIAMASSSAARRLTSMTAQDC